jgi:hypothetical protein
MMNSKNSQKSTRIVHGEYRDSQGNLCTEYEDTQGNIYTEYEDTQGNIHSDKNGYIEIDSQFTEEDIKNRGESPADKNILKGILFGVILTCVAGLSAGAIYFLTQEQNQRPIYWMNGRMGQMNERTPELNPPSETVQEPIEQKTQVSSPTAEPDKVIEQPISKIVPFPQAQAPEPTQKITSEPNTSNPPSQPESVNGAKPSNQTDTPVSEPIVIAPLNRTATNSNLSPTDRNLQKEILTRFDNNLPNHQLIVEVNNGQITVSGTVATPEQLEQIEPLLKSIEGIEKVDITATVASKGTAD